MVKNASILLSIAILLVETSFVTVLPAEAQRSSSRQRANRGFFSNLLVQLTQRRNTPQPRTSRGELCLVAPGLLESEERFEIWSDRPLFLWQGEASRLVVRDAETLETMWDYPISQNDISEIAPREHRVIYGGTRLEPQRLYEWRLVDASELNPSVSPLQSGSPQEEQFFAFRIMSETDQNQVTDASKGLSELLASRSELIAHQRAEYLVEQGLWSDALQTLYSVENPSLPFRQGLQELVISFCDNTR
jgi:hypothetical protein